MLIFITSLHVCVAILIIGSVLLQHGKGANMGASLGSSGGSQTLFGSRGPASFMFKLTMFLITIFFATSLGLGYIHKQNLNKRATEDNFSQIDYEKQREMQQSLIYQTENYYDNKG